MFLCAGTLQKRHINSVDDGQVCAVFFIQVRYKNPEPLWEEAFSFLVHNPYTQELAVEVFMPSLLNTTHNTIHYNKMQLVLHNTYSQELAVEILIISLLFLSWAPLSLHAIVLSLQTNVIQFNSIQFIQFFIPHPPRGIHRLYDNEKHHNTVKK